MKLRVPLHDLWWLVSRASGVIAVVLLSAAVLLGLAMAARALRQPSRRRAAMRLHEDLALVSLVAIAVHGLTLLGDSWLKPGLAGIAVPFAMPYRPLATGLGVLAGYLALLLGPSFYVRKRISAKRWRKLHRLTPLAWVLAAIHTLTAGSDAGTLWLRAVVMAPLPVLAYLGVVRWLGGKPVAHATAPAGTRSTQAGIVTHRHDPARRPAGRRGVTRQLEPERGSVSG